MAFAIFRGGDLKGLGEKEFMELPEVKNHH